MHPDFYLGPPMVKPPIVFLASLLRALGRGIDDDYWIWLSDMMGQQLFWPAQRLGLGRQPLARHLPDAGPLAVTTDYALDDDYFDPWNGPDYDPDEAPGPALDRALATWDYPPLRSEQQNELLSFSQNAFPTSLADWQRSPYRAMRQNALQQLIAVSPDLLLA